MKPVVLALALLALALAACTNASPCSTCPPLAGTYSVAWERALNLADGCAATGPQPQTLTFSQAGATASVLVDGVELQGSVYDTFDFSLSGTRPDVSYLLRGTVIPTDAATDAGVRITGSLTTRTDACELRENYTGDKISR
ncbi:MAG: hypothetical protein AB1730_04600 [Myxococcota bacterium]|jgi:hypothetical protein